MHSRSAPVGFRRVLFLSAFVIATCGLVYELVAGALASYLLGDSVTWFSLIIGTYLSAMGVGSYLSRYLDRALLSRFVEIEVAVALIGGLEAPLLFAGFVYSPGFKALLFAQVFAIWRPVRMGRVSPGPVISRRPCALLFGAKVLERR